MRAVLFLFSSALLLSPSAAFLPPQGTGRRAAPVRMSGSFYDIVEKDADGKQVSFAKFKGKVVYGVNVASQCGLTASNYALIRKLDGIPGLELALFPCNQFLFQEPGSDQQIAQFCLARGVSSANLFSKGDVNGPFTRPTYKLVKKEINMPLVPWNFQGKFLVDKKGKVLPVKSEATLEEDIKKLLAEK